MQRANESAYTWTVHDAWYWMNRKKMSDSDDQLCYDLFNDCPLLRNVVVKVPSSGERERNVYLHTPPELNYPTAAEWEDLLRPLQFLRVTKSIKLGPTCRHTNRLQSVFNRINSRVRSDEPGPALAGNEASD
ncbi:MAG: hypothetical protein Q9210_003991 [Variospora velana]